MEVQNRANSDDAFRVFRGKLNIAGVDHLQRCFDFTEGLIGLGYSDNKIPRILGGNLVRVLLEIWQRQDAEEKAAAAAR